jgi:hypothetical protein
LRPAVLGLLVSALLGGAACTPATASDDDDQGSGVGQSTTFDSESADGDESSSSGGGLPTTPEECFDVHLNMRGDNCDYESCTGSVLSCVNNYPDCPTCTSQCLAPQCSTDAECQEQFGDLCPGVQWICDQFWTTTYCAIDLGYGGSTSEGGSSTGQDWGSSTTGDVGCDAGDPFECAGDMLRDCAT